MVHLSDLGTSAILPPHVVMNGSVLGYVLSLMCQTGKKVKKGNVSNRSIVAQWVFLMQKIS